MSLKSVYVNVEEVLYLVLVEFDPNYVMVTRLYYDALYLKAIEAGTSILKLSLTIYGFCCCQHCNSGYLTQSTSKDASGHP